MTAEKLADALRQISDDCSFVIDQYERIGPSYTSTGTGEEYEPAGYVQAKMHELRAIALSALGSIGAAE